MNRTAAIIQARMGSSRLPGKVLRPILGRPMLGYLLERVRCIESLGAVCIATSDRTVDDAVAAFGAASGVPVFRGSEDDVLARFHGAACHLGLQQGDHVMRVTGDCPLFDPDVARQLGAVYKASGADYAITGPTFVEGLDCEIISFDALAASQQEAVLPSHREHVTLFIRENPERFRIVQAENDSDDSRFRLTVDDPEDFARAMLDEGIYVIGFSYPVVPKGQARIRVQITAAHTQAHLDQAIDAFSRIGKRLGVIP